MPTGEKAQLENQESCPLPPSYPGTPSPRIPGCPPTVAGEWHPAPPPSTWRSEFSTHTLSSVPCRHFQRVLTQWVLTQHVLPGCHRTITWPGCMLQQLRPLPAGPITLRPSQVWAQTGSLHVLWSQTLLERTGLWTWLPGTHEPFCLGQGLCRCDSQIRRDAEANVLRKARWS